jgi:hypothetical protein
MLVEYKIKEKTAMGISVYGFGRQWAWVGEYETGNALDNVQGVS